VSVSPIVPPRNSGKHCGGGPNNNRVCESVIGNGWHVATVHMWVTHTANTTDTARLYWISAFQPRHLWRHATATWIGTREFTWNPNCYGQSIVTIFANDTRNLGSVRVSVHGLSVSGLTPVCR